jgi:antitoxin component YwqK of YwqJK toxin-antitoxin module
MNKVNVLSVCLFCLLYLESCNSDFDKDGSLKVESLTSSSGALKFSPMLRSDSASVLSFKPDTFYYKGEVFTGAVAKYNQKMQRQFVGFIKDGLMDSTWFFYYLSGGLRMKGQYKKGWDIGRWRSYYGYDKVKIEKVYDEYGFMLSRSEYYDNGIMKSYQQVKNPSLGNKQRRLNWNRKGELDYIYVEDSILKRFSCDETEKVGEDMFME